jgi:hypothetical protein
MLPLLRSQLEHSYGADPEFTKTWDRLQIESKCCGISGPLDYNKTALFAGSKTQLNVPATCCHPSQTLPLQLLSSSVSNAGGGGKNSTVDQQGQRYRVEYLDEQVPQHLDELPTEM